MDKIEKKRQKEQYIVEEMIKLYCRKIIPGKDGRQVMRFSGPRMLLYHPLLAIWHLECSMKEKNKK